MLLHLSHHQGCLADVEYVAARLGIPVTSYTFDDGYNIGPERADRAWARWRDRLATADVVLTSDTAPLSRIVLQHMDEFEGQLVIWVCNRFDYHDAATNDCGFPDAAYYELFRIAAGHPRVQIVSFTPFEPHYARERGVDIGDTVIKPLGRVLPRVVPPVVPVDVNKPASVFVPPYHNDTILLDLGRVCAQGGFPAYSGRYGGADDIREFRAIVHIPYSWSTFALFENVQNGVPIFIPTARFLLKLSGLRKFFWPNSERLASLLHLSEWYNPAHDFLITFDSWPDLWMQLEHADLAVVRERMAVFASHHERVTLSVWERVLRARD